MGLEICVGGGFWVRLCRVGSVCVVLVPSVACCVVLGLSVSCWVRLCRVRLCRVGSVCLVFGPSVVVVRCCLRLCETQGDLIYASADSTLSRLPMGAANRVLKSDGTNVVWGIDDGGSGSGTSPADVTRIANLEYSNIGIWSNLASNRSNRVNASAVPPAKPAMT